MKLVLSDTGQTVDTAATTLQSVETPLYTEATSGGIGAGAEALGLDGRLLAAQIINFIILVLILRKFLYGPIVTLLEQRRKTIEESQQKAKEMEKRYAAFEVEYKQRLDETKKEAKAILDQARTTAQALRAESVAQTQTQTEKMIEKAKHDITNEKEKVMTDIQKEMGALVVAAVKKVIGESVNPELNNTMIEKAIREVSK
jgi:F-type H+-transporting ATPase subunit b